MILKFLWTFRGKKNKYYGKKRIKNMELIKVFKVVKMSKITI